MSKPAIPTELLAECLRMRAFNGGVNGDMVLAVIRAVIESDCDEDCTMVKEFYDQWVDMLDPNKYILLLAQCIARPPNIYI